MKATEKIWSGAILLLLVLSVGLSAVQLYRAQHSVVMICGDQPQGEAVYLYEHPVGAPILANPGSTVTWRVGVPYNLTEVWFSLTQNETGVPPSAAAVPTSPTTVGACGFLGPTPAINIGTLDNL